MNQLEDFPTLIFTNGPTLGDHDSVAELDSTVRVVHLKSTGPTDVFTVARVLDKSSDGNGDGFVSLV